MARNGPTGGSLSRTVRVPRKSRYARRVLTGWVATEASEVASLASRLVRRVPGGGPRLWALCRQHDKPNNGTVRIQDFHAALTTQLGISLSGADVGLLSKHLDSNGTGMVDYRLMTYLMKATAEAEGLQPTGSNKTSSQPGWSANGSTAENPSAPAGLKFADFQALLERENQQLTTAQRHVKSIPELGNDADEMRKERLHLEKAYKTSYEHLLSWDPKDFEAGEEGDMHCLKVVCMSDYVLVQVLAALISECAGG